MKKSTLFIVLLVAVAAIAVYAYKEWNRTNKDLKPVAADYSVTVTELLASFSKDTASANKTYTGKVLSVSGPVKSIDKEGNPVVIALGEKGEMSSVQCSMDSTYVKEYMPIKEGDNVKLKGICTGGRTEDLFGTDVILNRCVLENKLQ